MGALPCICALQFGAVLCSFQGFEPMQDGEPPTVRGDAPSGLFTPRWVELRQTYGIERPQGRRSEIYIHRLTSPYPDGINQLALRISTYEYPLGALLAIYFLSGTGHMPPKVPLGPLDQGGAVAWRLEGSGSCQHCG